jgi:hypothetical protein
VGLVTVMGLTTAMGCVGGPESLGLNSGTKLEKRNLERENHGYERIFSMHGVPLIVSPLVVIAFILAFVLCHGVLKSKFFN